MNGPAIRLTLPSPLTRLPVRPSMALEPVLAAPPEPSQPVPSPLPSLLSKALQQYLHAFGAPWPGPEVLDLATPHGRAVKLLFELGAYNSAGTTYHADCPHCGRLDLRGGHCYWTDEWRIECPNCGPSNAEPRPKPHVRINGSWLFQELAHQFREYAHRQPATLVAHYLFEVGQALREGVTTRILLARVTDDPCCESAIETGLRSLPPSDRALMLLTRPSVLEHMSIGGRRRVVALSEVAVLSPTGLELAANELLDLTPPEAPLPPSRLPVSLSDDDQLLTVGNRSLQLKGKQRDFARYIVNQRRKGIFKVKLMAALDAAKYDSDRLRDVSRNAKFYAFFASGGGDVWIQDGAPN